jgi:hypothetical protein
MGGRCTQARFLGGKPAKLRSTSKGELCDRCVQEGRHPEDAPTSSNAGRESPELETCSACQRLATELVNEAGDRLCGRCRAVFLAARVLLKEGISDEREIVPTVAFAAQTQAPWDLASENLPQNVTEVFAQTYNGFRLVRVIDGVPVLRQEPAVVEVERYADTDLPKRIWVRAFSRSAKAKYVAMLYEQVLLEECINYDRCKRIRVPNTEVVDAHLIMVVNPDRELTPEKAKVLSENPWRRRPSFPPPSLVRDYYKLIHGSVYKEQFKGYAYALPGRQSGPEKRGKKFLKACLAAHVNDHKDLKDSPEARPRAVRLMNRHVLEPCSEPGLPEHCGHARDYIFETAPGASHYLLQVEYLLQEYLQRDTPPSVLQRVFSQHP